MTGIKKIIASYEKDVEATDIARDQDHSFAIMGLAGELGDLCTIKKKELRSDKEFAQFNTSIEEELGDCLWYVCKLCRIAGIKLSDLVENAAKNCGGGNDSRIATIKALGDLTTESLTSDGVKSNGFRDELKKIGNLLVSIAEGEVDGGIQRVVSFNLEKTKSRYGENGVFSSCLHTDNEFPSWQKLPDEMTVSLEPVGGDQKTIAIIWNGIRYGDLLQDNKPVPDGYRFHDVYHFGFYALLGWSPVTRALLKMKRKNKSEIDDNEDGARAILVEEGIVHFVFNYCQSRNFEFEAGSRVDTNLLKTIKFMTQGFEVQDVETKLWEHAIVEITSVFKQMNENGGGKLILCRTSPSVAFEAL